MRATIYARVSTDEQSKEGTSLQTQLEACLAKAQELGYRVSPDDCIRESYSGLSLDRPGLSTLREMVAAGDVDAVIAYALDRVSRDPVHFIVLQDELEKAGAQLILVTEDLDSTDMGKLISYIKGYAAKLEVEKIRERSLRGMRQRARNGRLPGGGKVRLYGYTYVPGKGVGEGVRRINEHEAKRVRDIYRWYVEDGLSINGIVYRLREAGVPSPSGNREWSKSAVAKILKRVAYTGTTFAFTQRRVRSKRSGKLTSVETTPRKDWIELPTATPRMISEEVFQLTQARLQRNRELSPRNTKQSYLLRGYLFCTRCGRRYFGASSTKTRHGNEYHYRYYRCPKNFKIISSSTCDNRAWQADELEALVWEQIEQVLTQPDTILAGIEEEKRRLSEITSYETERERLTAQQRHLEKEKTRVWRAFELTGDEAKFKQEIERIGAAMNDIKKRRREIAERIEQTQELELNIDAIRGFCKTVRANLGAFTFEGKRLALEVLNVKVWLDDGHVIIEGAIPEVSSSVESTIAW